MPLTCTHTNAHITFLECCKQKSGHSSDSGSNSEHFGLFNSLIHSQRIQSAWNGWFTHFHFNENSIFHKSVSSSCFLLASFVRPPITVDCIILSLDINIKEGRHHFSLLFQMYGASKFVMYVQDTFLHGMNDIYEHSKAKEVQQFRRFLLLLLLQREGERNENQLRTTRMQTVSVQAIEI